MKSLKVIVKQGVKTEKDLNKGKRMTQKKEFHLEEIVDEVISSSKDDFISDEYNIEDCKARWICKSRK